MQGWVGNLTPHGGVKEQKLEGDASSLAALNLDPVFLMDSCAPNVKGFGVALQAKKCGT